MNYHNIETGSSVNGEGVRTVLWVAGCSHRCKGCHNPETWDMYGGKPFDAEAEKELFDSMEPFVSGITLSGGDPLFRFNREAIFQLITDFKHKFPDRTIWLYTGYEWEDILEMKNFPFLDVDVVVCGPFIEGLKDPSYHWAGSINQRVIKCPESYSNNRVINY